MRPPRRRRRRRLVVAALALLVAPAAAGATPRPAGEGAPVLRHRPAAGRARRRRHRRQRRVRRRDRGAGPGRRHHPPAELGPRADRGGDRGGALQVLVLVLIVAGRRRDRGDDRARVAAQPGGAAGALRRGAGVGGRAPRPGGPRVAAPRPGRRALSRAGRTARSRRCPRTRRCAGRRCGRTRCGPARRTPRRPGSPGCPRPGRRAEMVNVLSGVTSSTPGNVDAAHSPVRQSACRSAWSLVGHAQLGLGGHRPEVGQLARHREVAEVVEVVGEIGAVDDAMFSSSQYTRDARASSPSSVVAAAGHLVAVGVDHDQLVDRLHVPPSSSNSQRVELVQVDLDQLVACRLSVLERDVAARRRSLSASVELDLGGGAVDVLVGVRGALLGTVLVAVLEGADPIEAAAVGVQVVGIRPGQVADGEHAGHRLVEVDVGRLRTPPRRRRRPGRPRPREAVGLQLEVERAVERCRTGPGRRGRTRGRSRWPR